MFTDALISNAQKALFKRSSIIGQLTAGADGRWLCASENVTEVPAKLFAQAASSLFFAATVQPHAGLRTSCDRNQAT
jgi:hypothetical protein